MPRTAINALRRLALFRDVSARLLADLVESGGVREVSVPADGQFHPGTGTLVLALEGHVELRSQPVGMPPEEPTVERAKAASARLLRTGEAHLLDPSLSIDRPFDVQVARTAAARILVLDQPTLKQAVDASYSLAWSLPHIPPEWRSPAHAIWLTEAPGLGAPLPAVAGLLAAAMAMQFRESAAVAEVSADAGVDLAIWEASGLRPVPYTPHPDAPDRLAEIAAVLPPRTNLIFVDAAQPDRMTPLFETLRFHRIVYLTHATPDRIPPHLAARLREGAHGGEVPHFSSFIPTVVPPSAPRSRPAAPSLLAPLDGVLRALRRVFSDTLRSQPVGGTGRRRGDPVGPSAEQRLSRDTFRLRTDLSALGNRLAAWQPGPGNLPVATEMFQGDDGLRDAFFGWARATTNRRVGVALSGGGACSFRMVPFLKELTRRRVPVDLLSGLSGGALLGAYFCHGGSSGLDASTDRGPWIGLVALLAAFDSRWIAWFLDYELDSATLDQLAVEFAPLTTALFEVSPPEAHYLSSGTLGEAVRASGALPVFVAPVDASAGTRYVDGGTATPLPVDVLRDRGADLIIACNSVPGPESRNPFRGWRLGRFAYNWTLAGRVIDLWVSGAFMLQQISRQAAEDAHAYVEVPPNKLSLLEVFNFRGARGLADQAARDPGLPADVKRCVDLWNQFAGA
jgi:predicted acylesterase/phospholipase RssA